MGSQSSIIQRKDHINALAALGIIVDTIDFPTATVCPHCGAHTLHIYDDIARGDLWLDCTTCPAHGNIITFAADIWKIDALNAVAKFNELGVDTRTVSQENLNGLVRHDRLQRAYERFWALASSQLWQHGDDILSLKFKDLGLSREIPCEGFVGTATAPQVAELCSDIWCAYPKRMKSRRPFLVLPYEELPGLFSGFLLIQYHDEFDFKRAFLWSKPENQLAQGRDAGYFMLRHAMLSAHPETQNLQFVVDDPLWALKAQTIQLRHAQPLLPICASYAGGEAISHASSLQSVSRARRFFYARTITPELISQAANGRGYICPIKTDGLPRPSMPAKTLRTLGQLYKSAVTWQKTLTHVFETTNEIALQSFISRLIIPSERIREFFARTKVVTEDAAAQLLAKINPVYFSSTESTSYTSCVLVRDGCWYTSRGLIICNCIPVIERVVYTEKEKYYAGYIRKQNKRIDFVEKSERIEKMGFLEYASHLMAAHNELVVFTPVWNRRSHITAMTFHVPEIVHTRVAPGWDEKTREFYVARYSITQSGAVKPALYPEIKGDKTFDLPEPAAVAPLTIHQLLTPSTENAFVWTVVAAALANMLAPALGRDATGVCVPAELFIGTNETLKPLDIQHTEIRAIHRGVVRLFSEKLKKTDWPQLVSVTGTNDKFLSEGLIKYPNSAAIVRIAAATTTTALSYGWNVINSSEAPHGLDCSAVPYVVAAYIQKTLQKRMTIGAPGKPLIPTILSDLHNWLAETYGNAFNLTRAEKNLLSPGQEHVTLMLEINRAIADQQIDVLPRQRNSRQDFNYIVRNKETWWLNRRAIDRYFNMVSGTIPNWLALADSFSKQGILRGERIINGMPGLMVDREWCDQFWEDYKNTQSQDVG